MALCPACSRPYEGSPDFCPHCNEYLRWSPTGYQTPVPEPGAPVRPERRGSDVGEARGGGAEGGEQRRLAPLLALRRPTDRESATEALTLRVATESTVEIHALIRNESGLVETYDVSLEGIPDAWWSVEPGAVSLVPYTAPQGTYEEEVTIRITPPRRAEAEARIWQLRVVATPRGDATQRAVAPCTLEVEPFAAIQTQVRPERRSGRMQARFDVTITNVANAPVDVALAASDKDGLLRFEFQRPATARAGTPIDPARVAERALRDAQARGVDALASDKLAAEGATRLRAARGSLMARVVGRRRAGPRVEGLNIGPGESAEAVLVVTPPRQVWIGKTTPRPFTVGPRPIGRGPTEGGGPLRPAEMQQKPWLPWWSAIVVPLAVVAVAWFLASQPEKVTVPDLASAPNAFTAEKMLKAVGLELAKPPETVPADGAEAGAIVNQAPAAGEKAEKGSSVSIQMAVAPETVEVPNLKGLPLANAQSSLEQLGLGLGPLDDAPADVSTAIVSASNPGPGEQVEKGSPVSLTLVAPTGTTTDAAPTTPTTSTTSTDEVPPPASALVPPIVPPRQPAAEPAPPVPEMASKDGEVVVPDLVAHERSAVETSLAGVGLTTTVVPTYDAEVPAERVVAQDPPPGSPVQEGGLVTLTVSYGEPELVFDNGKDLFRVSGVDGTSRAPVARTGGLEGEASASRDGRLLAFGRQPDPRNRTDARIVVIELADPSRATELTTGGFNDHRPAISPDGSTVAFVSNRKAAGVEGLETLCFARVDRPGVEPSCKEDRSVSVSRPTWSADGRAILVPARPSPAGPSDQVELLQYRSQVANSADEADWKKRALVTDTFHGAGAKHAIYSAAYSPDGSRLAFTADWGGGVATLHIVDVTSDGTPAAEPIQFPRVPVCEVGWRPDGGELVATRRAGPSCSGAGQVGRVDLDTGDFEPLTDARQEAGNPLFLPVAQP